MILRFIGTHDVAANYTFIIKKISYIVVFDVKHFYFEKEKLIKSDVRMSYASICCVINK